MLIKESILVLPSDTFSMAEIHKTIFNQKYEWLEQQNNNNKKKDSKNQDCR